MAGQFTQFLPPAVREAGAARLLVVLTFAEIGIRLLVPTNRFGMRLFHMLTAEYANADNDNEGRG